MFTIRHSTFKLRMMEVVDVDWKYVIDNIWETSEFVMEHKLSKDDIMIESLNICRLDPGGIFNMKEEWKRFDIDNYKFEVQLSKIDWVIYKVESANERVPGVMRFAMWRWNVLCSTELYIKLLEKLRSLQKTDETLHAQISDFEIKNKLQEKGYCIFPEIPREE